MRVEIDQPGYDKEPAHIDDLTSARGEVGRNFAYLSVVEGDIGRLVMPARRVDDAPPLSIDATNAPMTPAAQSDHCSLVDPAGAPTSATHSSSALYLTDNPSNGIGE
jgi:hypothetical protein